MMDRLEAIINAIEKWKTNDPTLQDKNGFLQAIKDMNIGAFRVEDTIKWMKLYKESKKRKIPIAELIFEEYSMMVNKERVIDDLILDKQDDYFHSKIIRSEESRVLEVYQRLVKFVGESFIPVKYLVYQYNLGLPEQSKKTSNELVILLKRLNFKKRQVSVTGWYLDMSNR